MPGSLGEAVLDLVGDASQLYADVNRAKGNVLDMLNGLSQVGGAIVTGGLMVAGAGVAALSKGLYDVVQAGAEAEQVQAQLNAVLKSTGGVAGVTADMVNSLADKYSNLTMFDDEAIVSAENLMLTFTNIGKNVFPDATVAVMNLSQSMQQDLKTSAIQLGKALQDPVEGVGALSRVGVNFSDSQQELIKSLVEAGRLEEAQVMILRELQTEFGGSAEAAGKTLPGQIAILQKKLGDIQELFADKINPILAKFFGMINEYISRPETQAFLEELATKIGEFAQTALENIPNVIQTFKNMVTWLQNNKGVIVGVLAAVGAAIAAFAYTTLAPLLPVAAVLAAIGAVAYLIYEAWTNNWGGIRDTLMGVWAALQPVFEQIKAWLAVAIPAALATLKEWWNNLMTALTPIINTLKAWFAVAIPAALAILKAWWEITLNNLKIIWDFLSTYVFPILKAVADVIMAVLGVAFKAWAGIMQNVVIPMLERLWNWIETYVLPVIKKLSDWLTEKLKPAFEFISKEISGVVAWLEVLAYRLSRMKLPDWMTPGSPTPWEIGLWGINDALKAVARVQLPQLSASLGLAPMPALAGGDMQFMSGGVVPVQFVYQPFIGMNDEFEAANKLRDIVDRLDRERRNR